MNILICSAGRRVKLIQYFKEELHKMNGKVIAIDCDPTAPALYHADHYEIVPRITHPEYVDYLKSLCKKYSIRGILTLIDPELSLLASCKSEFEREGVQMVVSDPEMVATSYDKYLTWQFLYENGIPAIPTYHHFDKAVQDIEAGILRFPLMVKPKNGSASLGLNKIHTMNELMKFDHESDEWIVQPYIDGEEYGVDCYVDMVTQEATSIFMKRKLAMRAGETDKSISIQDPDLKELIEKLIRALKPIGPIDVDCFKTEAGYFISEINPRFGGGYPHAHEMGENFVASILANLEGKPSRVNTEAYKEGVAMVKYDHVLMIDENQLKPASFFLRDQVMVQSAGGASPALIVSRT